jgi:hypothetical protein
VRTTINDLVDRQGGAYSIEDLEDCLNRARKLLADTAAFLELQMDHLCGREIDTNLDKDGIKQIQSLVADVRRCMLTVLELQAKHGLTGAETAGALNLEDARDEVLRRLARLAA